MLQIRWCDGVANAHIRAKIGQPFDSLQLLQKSRLTWYEYALLMPEDRHPKENPIL